MSTNDLHEYFRLLYAVRQAARAHDQAGAKHLACRGLLTPDSADMKPGEKDLLIAYATARQVLDAAHLKLEQWERSHDWAAVLVQTSVLPPPCSCKACAVCGVLS